MINLHWIQEGESVWRCEPSPWGGRGVIPVRYQFLGHLRRGEALFERPPIDRARAQGSPPVFVFSDWMLHPRPEEAVAAHVAFLECQIADLLWSRYGVS